MSGEVAADKSLRGPLSDEGRTLKLVVGVGAEGGGGGRIRSGKWDSDSDCRTRGGVDGGEKSYRN